eukprot:UN03433
MYFLLLKPTPPGIQSLIPPNSTFFYRKISQDFLRYYDHTMCINKTDIIMYNILYNNPRKIFVMEFTIYTKLYIFSVKNLAILSMYTSVKFSK